MCCLLATNHCFAVTMWYQFDTYELGFNTIFISRIWGVLRQKSRAASLSSVLARHPIELIPSPWTRLALEKWGTIVVGTRVHSRNARDAKIATNSYSCCTHLLALHYGSVYFIVITLKTAELADTWLESLIGTACSEDKQNKASRRFPSALPVQNPLGCLVYLINYTYTTHF